MPADLRGACYECSARVEVSADAERWRCRPCDRAGYFTTGYVGTRQVLVRMVTRWRDAEGLVHGA